VYVGDTKGVVVSYDPAGSEFIVAEGEEKTDGSGCVTTDASSPQQVVSCSAVRLVQPVQQDAVVVVQPQGQVALGSIGELIGFDESDMIIRVVQSGDIQILPEHCLGKLNDRTALARANGAVAL
jgi:hypothetical protein